MGRIYHHANIPAVIAQFLCLSGAAAYFFTELNDANAPLGLANISAILLLISTLILSRYVGGWSIVTLPHALCTLSLITLVLTNFSSVRLYIIASLLWVIHLAMVYFHPYYEFPKPRGRYKAGYLYRKHGNVSFSVFYPTEETNRPLAKLFYAKNHLEDFYTIATCLYRLMPRFLFDILNDYCYKLRINAYEATRIVSPNDPSFEKADKKFTPIIFSHGLGTHCNAYSTICSELASHGYIIFSLDHSEDIAEIFRDRSVATAKKYLAKRMSECIDLLDGLEKGKLLQELFDEPISLAFDKLTIIGHSYGGATAAVTAKQDSRIKNCVLFDPWLEPLDKLEECKLNCNLLILESDTFDAFAPELKVRERNKLLVKSQLRNRNSSLYTIVGRSDHSSFTDNSLIIGPVLTIAKQIKYYSEVEEMMSLISSLVHRYLKIIVEGQTENADSNSRVERYLDTFKENSNLSFERI